MTRPTWTIAGHGLTATFTDLGAILHDLRLDGHDAPLVLGLADLDHYPEHSSYMGATAGRCINRIGGASFVLDGRRHDTDPNFLGRHTLHGGSAGLGKRVWEATEVSANAITFAVEQADGDMGFPGALRVTARFDCAPDATLRVTYRAETDAPTICNVGHHTYWCLDETGGLDDHVLTVPGADRYVAVDDDLIPTEVRSVDGTPFDFRAGRVPVGGGDVLDHNLCLSDGRVPWRDVATLHSRASGVTMRLGTTEPGLQVYDGAKLKSPVPGLAGRPNGSRSGVALEPQAWPDAPNRPDFPSAVLRPGDAYEQVTTFQFSKG
ncbi:aldose epimerase family protein [Jannaschia sp. LMIT008]|uniref:aldose epimerase family protein n=1 Tax=Jannaschia maritima TaxID=3032585 RepID=UPI002811DB6C|nr:aldose epimerase family protein [Jannaschia sp. LMIT008]